MQLYIPLLSNNELNERDKQVVWLPYEITLLSNSTACHDWQCFVWLPYEITIWLYSNAGQWVICDKKIALHSNLVIFQQLQSSPSIPGSQWFTFQSGYIPTDINYSRALTLTLFTFQSGYIPTVNIFSCLRFYDNFTFQSGYIPTNLEPSNTRPP